MRPNCTQNVDGGPAHSDGGPAHSAGYGAHARSFLVPGWRITGQAPPRPTRDSEGPETRRAALTIPLALARVHAPHRRQSEDATTSDTPDTWVPVAHPSPADSPPIPTSTTLRPSARQRATRCQGLSRTAPMRRSMPGTAPATVDSSPFAWPSRSCSLRGANRPPPTIPDTRGVRFMPVPASNALPYNTSTGTPDTATTPVPVEVSRTRATRATRASRATSYARTRSATRARCQPWYPSIRSFCFARR